MGTLQVTVQRQDQDEDVSLDFDVALLAGFTGRDRDAAQAHVDELSAQGIDVPERIPTIYAVPGSRVTVADAIAVDGAETCGEVEFVLARHDGRTLVTVASDHTDRALERHSIVKAKQGTDKPVAATWWDLADIADHWDSLVLTGEVRTPDGWITYQEGSLATMMQPLELLTHVEERWGSHVSRQAVFSGTLAIVGGEFVFGDAFRATLDDPVLGRSLVHEYAVVVLPRLD